MKEWNESEAGTKDVSALYLKGERERGLSNDAYPQDANLTLVGKIYFPSRYIFPSVLFGLFLFSFE